MDDDDEFDREEPEDEEEEDEEDEEEETPEDEYYHAKETKNTTEKLARLKKVIELEGSKPGEWGFKAHKRYVKIFFAQKKYVEMMAKYKAMLKYIQRSVTRTLSEKVITGLLDLISTCDSMEVLVEFYQTTLDALAAAKNERLWFKTNLKLANLYFQRKEIPKMLKICQDLEKSCKKPDGSDDTNKGSSLLEIFSLEIQYYTESKNNKKLKEIYERAMQVKNALIHPRFLATIRECGGKMHMHERNFRASATDFFEAFCRYDEAGSPKRISCLKYLILANMMGESSVNPMTAQETRAFKDDPDIVALTDLIEAYQSSNIQRFEKILTDPKRKEAILGDPFIRQYIDDLMKNIRTAKLKNLLRPYTTIRLDYLSQQINTPVPDVEALLVGLILDGHVFGRIDQIAGILVLEDKTQSNRKFQALGRWAGEIVGLRQSLLAKMI